MAFAMLAAGHPRTTISDVLGVSAAVVTRWKRLKPYIPPDDRGDEWMQIVASLRGKTASQLLDALPQFGRQVERFLGIAGSSRIRPPAPLVERDVYFGLVIHPHVDIEAITAFLQSVEQQLQVDGLASPVLVATVPGNRADVIALLQSRNVHVFADPMLFSNPHQHLIGEIAALQTARLRALVVPESESKTRARLASSFVVFTDGEVVLERDAIRRLAGMHWGQSHGPLVTMHAFRVQLGQVDAIVRPDRHKTSGAEALSRLGTVRVVLQGGIDPRHAFVKPEYQLSPHLTSVSLSGICDARTRLARQILPSSLWLDNTGNEIAALLAPQLVDGQRSRGTVVLSSAPIATLHPSTVVSDRPGVGSDLSRRLASADQNGPDVPDRPRSPEEASLPICGIREVPAKFPRVIGRSGLPWIVESRFDGAVVNVTYPADNGAGSLQVSLLGEGWNVPFQLNFRDVIRSVSAMPNVPDVSLSLLRVRDVEPMFEMIRNGIRQKATCFDTYDPELKRLRSSAEWLNMLVEANGIARGRKREGYVYAVSESSRFVGMVRLYYPTEDFLDPQKEHLVEMGILVHPSARGRGIGQAAIELGTLLALSDPGVDGVRANIYATNNTSIRRFHAAFTTWMGSNSETGYHEGPSEYNDMVSLYFRPEYLPQGVVPPLVRTASPLLPRPGLGLDGMVLQA